MGGAPAQGLAIGLAGTPPARTEAQAPTTERYWMTDVVVASGVPEAASLRVMSYTTSYVPFAPQIEEAQ
jgi:hypothetical protein